MASLNLPLVSLMHPTLIAGPFHREGWVYEEQYDGCRMVAYKDGTAVRLINQAGQDHAQRFPELVAALRALPARTLILDGEVCIFDPQLISRFEWLWRRPTGETATPALFMAFDCLYPRRQDLRVRALRVRRQVLEAEVEGRHHVLPARRLADAGLTAWAEVLARGYEGLVPKDLESRYVPGRTLAWSQGQAAPLPRGRARLGVEAALGGAKVPISRLTRGREGQGGLHPPDGEARTMKVEVAVARTVHPVENIRG